MVRASEVKYLDGKSSRHNGYTLLSYHNGEREVFFVPDWNNGEPEMTQSLKWSGACLALAARHQKLNESQKNN